MKEQEFQQIKEVTRMATDEPWELDRDDSDGTLWISLGKRIDLIFPEYSRQDELDATFIAHARCYIPALCDALDEALAQLRELHTAQANYFNSKKGEK